MQFQWKKACRVLWSHNQMRPQCISIGRRLAECCGLITRWMADITQLRLSLVICESSHAKNRCQLCFCCCFLFNKVKRIGLSSKLTWEGRYDIMATNRFGGEYIFARWCQIYITGRSRTTTCNSDQPCGKDRWRKIVIVSSRSRFTRSWPTGTQSAALFVMPKTWKAFRMVFCYTCF